MATDPLGRPQRTATASLPMARGAMPLLGVMVFIVSLGYGAGLPLIRPCLLRYLGAVPASTVAWHVGMLGGVYLFALFLFGPLWGRLSDRYGRVPVLLIGFAAFLVASVGTALAPSLGVVYAARLVAPAGAAAIVPTAQTSVRTSIAVAASCCWGVRPSSAPRRAGIRHLAGRAGDGGGRWEDGRHAELAGTCRRVGGRAAAADRPLGSRTEPRRRAVCGCGRRRIPQMLRAFIDVACAGSIVRLRHVRGMTPGHRTERAGRRKHARSSYS